MLQENNLTLQRVLEIARALETANYQSDVIVGKPINDNINQVNHVAYKKSYQNVKKGQVHQRGKPNPGISQNNKGKVWVLPKTH